MAERVWLPRGGGPAELIRLDKQAACFWHGTSGGWVCRHVCTSCLLVECGAAAAAHYTSTDRSLGVVLGVVWGVVWGPQRISWCMCTTWCWAAFPLTVGASLLLNTDECCFGALL